MKRSEQDIRFQWDLTKIYPDTVRLRPRSSL